MRAVRAMQRGIDAASTLSDKRRSVRLSRKSVSGPDCSGAYLRIAGRCVVGVEAGRLQDAVKMLRELGPLPSEAQADRASLQRIEMLMKAIDLPVSDEDARVLVELFGADDCFGMAWTLLHAIETAPGWPLKDCLIAPDNEWIVLLRQRCANAGRL